MTAEIAVMNKSAIALAADSAVTIEHPTGQKVYNTINKLFALSRHQPVGMMVFGGAELLGVPWETILRVYQAKLASRKFNTLQGYANDFLSFLDRKNPLFPAKQQDDDFVFSVLGYFTSLRTETDKQVKSTITKTGKADSATIRKIAATVIQSHFNNWKKAPHLDSMPKSHKRRILTRYRKQIVAAINTAFEKLPLSNRSRRQLLDMAGDTCCKRLFSLGASGVVIAGFGEKQIFPEVVAYDVDTVILNRLKYAKKERKCYRITHQHEACIMPFAQEDVVYTFVEGVDPQYQRLVDSLLSSGLGLYPDKIVGGLPGIAGPKKDKLIKAIRKFGEKLQQAFGEDLHKYRKNSHVDPLVEVVRVLPKDDLAAMAESLVNLTCLKKKMSFGAETVGGPIDVAVISKGEGLIWIKRKHYFTKDLNPQFFEKYKTGV